MVRIVCLFLAPFSVRSVESAWNVEQFRTSVSVLVAVGGGGAAAVVIVNIAQWYLESSTTNGNVHTQGESIRIGTCVLRILSHFASYFVRFQSVCRLWLFSNVSLATAAARASERDSNTHTPNTKAIARNSCGIGIGLFGTFPTPALWYSSSFSIILGVFVRRRQRLQN